MFFVCVLSIGQMCKKGKLPIPRWVFLPCPESGPKVILYWPVYFIQVLLETRRVIITVILLNLLNKISKDTSNFKRSSYFDTCS